MAFGEVFGFVSAMSTRFGRWPAAFLSPLARSVPLLYPQNSSSGSGRSKVTLLEPQHANDPKHTSQSGGEVGQHGDQRANQHTGAKITAMNRPISERGPRTRKLTKRNEWFASFIVRFSVHFNFIIKLSRNPPFTVKKH